MGKLVCSNSPGERRALQPHHNSRLHSCCLSITAQTQQPPPAQQRPAAATGHRSSVCITSSSQSPVRVRSLPRKALQAHLPSHCSAYNLCDGSVCPAGTVTLPTARLKPSLPAHDAQSKALTNPGNSAQLPAASIYWQCRPLLKQGQLPQHVPLKQLSPLSTLAAHIAG